MGINFYFITRNTKLVHEHFAQGYDEYSTWGEEYELCDIPDFHYEIHINKLSYGWKPLFQNHKAFRTFTQLEQFYKEHKEDLTIQDEYGDIYTFEQYKQEILDHGNVSPEPRKWVVKDEPAMFSGGKRLTTEKCEPEEAELWTPYDHLDYGRTERLAAGRLHYNGYVGWKDVDDYHRDPEYYIDWVEGEFL